ncbi:MAG: hypothetical protein WA102_02970 [Candidatus Methanoperedens sp.]
MKEKNDLKITFEYTKDKTKEEFIVSPDEAFAIRAIILHIKKFYPEKRPSWFEACKLAHIMDIKGDR